MMQGTHPVALVLLEEYVRRPLEGTWFERRLLRPVRDAYLSTVNARAKHTKVE